MAQLSITYKIYLEADDISASRIKSSTAFMRHLLEGSRNSYLKHADIDDESDLDEFTMRFYIENSIHEDVCTSTDDAESFVLDMAELLDKAASAQSYMDMEGSFSWEFDGRQKKYRFQSESGQDYCEIVEE